MNILLIEDAAGFAVPIQQALEARGHKVTWFVGATSVGKGRLVGILASPNAEPFEDTFDGDESRLKDVNLADFDLALVDGGLIGPVNAGTVFVAALAEAKVPSIAISGGGAGNPPLIASGAVAGVPKEYVVRAVEGGHLDIKLPLKAPKRLAKRLESFTCELRSKVLEARQQGERLDLGYPALAKLS